VGNGFLGVYIVCMPWRIAERQCTILNHPANTFAWTGRVCTVQRPLAWDLRYSYRCLLQLMNPPWSQLTTAIQARSWSVVCLSGWFYLSPSVIAHNLAPKPNFLTRTHCWQISTIDRRRWCEGTLQYTGTTEMGDDRDSTIDREVAEEIVIFRDTKKISGGGCSYDGVKGVCTFSQFWQMSSLV